MNRFSTYLLLLAPLSLVAQKTTWELDKNHTDIGFTATHMVISEVYGEFKEFDGSVMSEGEGFVGATVSFTAEVGSIDTDNDRRNGHLKSDDFFNAEKFPQIKFNGKIIEEEGQLMMVGDFTMRDVTKEEKFMVKYNGTIPARNGRKAGFKITGTVNRFEYGLKWDNALETGGLVVGEEIGIVCNVELDEKNAG